VHDASGQLLFENRVHLAQDSRTAQLLSHRPSLLTNSFHHQAVARPGAGLRVVGATRDPITGRDSVEMTEGWNVLTTQFHPELMLDDDAAHKLLWTVGRRARVFALVKQLRRRHGRVTLGLLIEAMRQCPAASFEASDYAWVRRDLAPRLGGRAPLSHAAGSLAGTD
jgi:hypothetical protein